MKSILSVSLLFALLAQASFCLLLFFYNIDRFPLKNWDEAWYAEQTRNMVYEDHGFIVPFWNGRYYFDKPPLYFWLSSPFFKFFGSGEWQARVVSSSSAVFATVLVFLLGRRLFSARVGFLSILVFLLLGHVYGRFSEGDLDSLMIALFLASFYFYLKSQEKLKYLVLSGIFAGFSVLVKGWLLGLFPVFSIFVYSLFANRQFVGKLTVFGLSFLVSFLWWFVLGFWKFGWQFLDAFLFHPAAGTLGNPFSNFSLAYFQFFLLDFGFFILPASLFLTLLFQKKVSLDSRVYPLVFIGFTFIFALNFLSGKNDWYLLPAYPFLAISLGFMLKELFQKFGRVFLFMLVPVLFLQLLLVWRIETRYPDRSYIGATLGLAAGQLVPKGANVVLDDHDFTAFLFYSNLGRVYELSNGGEKSWEWWVVKKSDLPRFFDRERNVWVVTPSLDRLPQGFSYQVVGEQEGYKFVKVEE